MTISAKVEARCEDVGGTDEVVGWEVWSGDKWLGTFDNEDDAIDYCAAIISANGRGGDPLHLRNKHYI